MYRNLVLIFNYLNLLVIKIAVVLGAILFFIDYRFVLSMFVGMLFSFIVFRQFLNSQEAIVKQKKKGLFFIYYCARLGLYALPIGCAFYFKNYLNIFIILVFLFTYQVLYISIEFNRSLKKYKRQKQQWKD